MTLFAKRCYVPGLTQWGISGFITPKLPKLDITTDAEYAADLVNVSIWLYTCDSAVYYMGILHLHKDIFLTGITGYDQLKFS